MIVRVGPARQDDRHAGAEHDAGRIRIGQEGQALGQHVAGLEIGHDEHVGLPGDRRSIFLIFAAPRSMALSSASGPSRMPPVIWPRSAILHSAAASMVEGTFGFTVSIADRIATRTGLDPQRVREIDGVLDDVDLVLQRRRDVDRRVGDDQRPIVAGHVHDEAMADPARRAQAALAAHDGAP